MSLIDERQKCLTIAHDLLLHHGQVHWTEDARRWDWHEHPVPTYPMFTDCSGGFTAIDYWAGCGDPNDLDFRGGNTGTLLHHARQTRLIITKAQMLAADGCLFADPADPNYPRHVAMALQDGTHKDPLFFNLGGPADPSIQPLSVLSGIGKPIFFRNVTRHR